MVWRGSLVTANIASKYWPWCHRHDGDFLGLLSVFRSEDQASRLKSAPTVIIGRWVGKHHRGGGVLVLSGPLGGGKRSALPPVAQLQSGHANNAEKAHLIREGCAVTDSPVINRGPELER
jgi:hypothetical protein